MEINIYTTLVWFSAILIGSLDLVIFLGSSNPSSRAFTHSIFWVTIWITCVGLFVATSKDYQSAIFFSRMTYFLGSTIAASFLYFFLSYPEDRKISNWIKWSILTVQIIFAYLFLFTDTIVSKLFPISGNNFLGWGFGPLSPLFEIFFFGFFGTGIVILYYKFKKCTDLNTKANLKYMLWVIVVGATPPSLMCIILPRFGYYDLNWLGPVTELIWIPIFSYSIIKYRQMNVKAVTAEILAIAMTVILFINIFLNITSDLWLSVITFIAFITLAFYLIKSILLETRQAELLKDLNENLEAKVAEQTQEIRKSYDMEKHARRELEKLNETKDQFIMITQHHLRAPVTGIKCQLESILSGEHGDIDSKLRGSIADANAGAVRLTKIVNDFLAITAIKPGGNILNLASASLKPMIVDILAELYIDIEQKKLIVNYPEDEKSWPILMVDASKMRDALLIIIENAVRYNILGGRIEMKTSISGDSFELSVTDTGVGINPLDREKIFGNLFHRSEVARKANPMGMGVGLSVARAIVRAHHGELELVSEGEGRGTKVVVRVRGGGF